MSLSASSSSQCVEISIVDDNIFESDEERFLVMLIVEGENSIYIDYGESLHSATVVIVDDGEYIYTSNDVHYNTWL